MPVYVSDFTALISGQSWSGEEGTPTVVTYSFEDEPSDYLYNETFFTDAFLNSFQPFTNAQEALAEQALAEWSAVSGIVFIEVPAGEGDIRFGNHDFTQDPRTSQFTGYGFYPNRGVTETSAYDYESGGHIYFDLSIRGNTNYGLMLHEIGHALGLKHPFDGEIRLEDAFDNGTYTIMSYDRPGVQALGMFDDDITQHLYGTPGFTPGPNGGITGFSVNQNAMTTTQTWGNGASDVLGSSIHDDINAGGGADKVAGLKGNDMLHGGAGNDTMFGGKGDDTLIGGLGNDMIYGGDFAGDMDAGSNTVSYAGIGANLNLSLGMGNSMGTASSSGSGSDQLSEIDHAVGGSGSDKMQGNENGNLLIGGDGLDTLRGEGGNDTLLGGAFGDRLFGGNGNDSLEGGQGFDGLYGNAGDDTLKAGDNPDRLYGGRGDDMLYGGSNVGGRDGLYGDEGNDTLYGQVGFDLLDGGDGDDMLDGGNQADVLFGRDGNDLMRGGNGLDRLFGGNGDDTGYGGTGNDGLFGQRGDDVLFGQAGNDRFFAGQGNDKLFGGSGNDTMFGGAGFDTLDGGTGNDRLSGNFNADTFVFADGHGDDTIVDFDEFNALEKIDLSAVSAIVNLADLKNNHLNQIGSDVVIDTGGGNSITLNNVNINDLDNSDFIFTT